MLVVNEGGKSLRKLLVVLVLGILIACSNSQDEAKKTVDGYLEAVHDGGDIYDYISIGTDSLIDVIDYEYLRALEAEEIKDTRTYDIEFYEDVVSDSYDTYQDFKEDQKEMYDDYEVITETYDNLILWDGESYVDNHKLLYNVELTNELGQKLYKKVEFYLEYSSYDEKYIIEEINIR